MEDQNQLQSKQKAIVRRPPFILRLISYLLLTMMVALLLIAAIAFTVTNELWTVFQRLPAYHILAAVTGSILFEVCTHLLAKRWPNTFTNAAPIDERMPLVGGILCVCTAATAVIIGGNRGFQETAAAIIIAPVAALIISFTINRLKRRFSQVTTDTETIGLE